MLSVKDKERFLSKFVPEPNTGCWLWTAGQDKDGYGKIKISSLKIKNQRAHRVSYALFKGAIGDKYVLHKCDQPSCVNPEHLWIGTNQDNMDDMHRKGRWAAKIKTNCINGHEFSENNTKRNTSTGYRYCVACFKSTQKRYLSRRK